jgi:hypothetical protein
MKKPGNTSGGLSSLASRARARALGGIKCHSAAVRHGEAVRFPENDFDAAPDASMQQRLVARAADIGKHWPELPVARQRAVLTGRSNGSRRASTRSTSVSARLGWARYSMELRHRRKALTPLFQQPRTVDRFPNVLPR